MGIRDVRARLRHCDSNFSFQVICDIDMVSHLRRVVAWDDGVITEQEKCHRGIILHIKKQRTPQ